MKFCTGKCELSTEIRIYRKVDEWIKSAEDVRGVDTRFGRTIHRPQRVYGDGVKRSARLEQPKNRQ